MATLVLITLRTFQLPRDCDTKHDLQKSSQTYINIYNLCIFNAIMYILVSVTIPPLSGIAYRDLRYLFSPTSLVYHISRMYSQATLFIAVAVAIKAC
jgi:hypothetical protein